MSTSTSKLPLLHGQRLAARLVEILSPHCKKIDIAGSIRRMISCTPLAFWLLSVDFCKWAGSVILSVFSFLF